MEEIDNIYVINLQKDKDRYTKVYKEITEKLKTIPTRIKGIYGKNLTKEQIKQVCSPLYAKFGAHSVIGCALSHIKTWETIVKNNDSVSIIFEDDAVLDNDILEKFNKVFPTIPKDFYLVYLSCFGMCDINKKYSLPNTVLKFMTKYTKQVKKINEDIYTPSIPLGLHAYMLSNKGAKYLLKNIRKDKIKFHIDHQILKYIYTIPTYAISPNLATQGKMEAFTSNNSSNYPILLNKLLNNIRDKQSGVGLDYIFGVNVFEIKGYSINLYTVLAILIGIISGLYKVNPSTLINILLLYHIPEWFSTNFITLRESIITIGIILISYYLSK